MSRFLNSMQARVSGLFMLFLVLASAILLALAYSGSNSVFQKQATVDMDSTLTFRADMLVERLEQVRGQADSIARLEALKMDLTNLKSGWKTLDKTTGDASAALIDVFITNNPNPADKRELLVKPAGPSGFYFSSHEKAQNDIKAFIDTSPFSDILMIDTNGNVVYSYRKTDAFAQDLLSGDLADTGLGSVYQAGMKAVGASTDGETAPTAFSGLTISSVTKKTDFYFAVPILNLGSARGIMVFKVRDDIIAQVMSKALPAGGQEMVNLIGEEGNVLGLDQSGNIVAVAAEPFGFFKGALAAKGDFSAEFSRADGPARAFTRVVSFDGRKYLVAESESLKALQAGPRKIAFLMAGGGVAVVLVAMLVSAFFLRKLLSPLGNLAVATAAVANGDLNTEIAYQDRKDEVGSMSRSLEGFRQSLARQKEMEADAMRFAAETERERQQRQDEREAQAAELENVVNALGSGLSRLAGGDLSCAIAQQFPATLEPLRTNFNQSVEQLRDALIAIGGNSMAVREGSSEMRTSADQLAARTERQAVSISQAAASIDAVTQAVREQLARAEGAARIADAAQGGANESAGIMRNTIEAMENIQRSSHQINQIIGVIDEIAFQTNLLALNAGVEAARAGDSGKGFAVVAQEVRELAQRSAAAAKEITALLKKSTGDVDAGVRLVEKAGHSINAIGDQVTDIDGRIRAIMESTREEADSLRNINASVNELEAATQQNAAMVEETTAAVHKLAHEAGEMDARLGQFVLEAAAEDTRRWAKVS